MMGSFETVMEELRFNREENNSKIDGLHKDIKTLTISNAKIETDITYLIKTQKNYGLRLCKIEKLEMENYWCCGNTCNINSSSNSNGVINVSNFKSL